jgi:hypothetical protein
MEVNGIDLSGLAHEATKIVLPDPVKGRVVHIDADFLAYQTSAEKADGSDTKTFEDMKHNAGVAIKMLMSLAGATGCHLHITPSTSDKGGRHSLAIQREYQANREGKAKPRYLHIMREHLAQHYPSTQWQAAEADDGMAAANYAAIKNGTPNLSIIATKDKDLNMVPGLHLKWDTGEIIDADVFGDVTLRVRGSGTKVLDGYGQKFFWAQMLAGDSADNIQGLPKVVGWYMNKFKPVATTSTALYMLDKYRAEDNEYKQAMAKLMSRPAGLCGPVIVNDILASVTNAKDAFLLVKDMYKQYGEQFGFKHWKTGEDVPWNKVFISEAQLLWMRRNPHDRTDVLNWFKETFN